ncbi:hypothetical protein D9M69_448860 [compost metagenome]
MRRVRDWALSSLPLLLSRLRAARVKACWLEISPPWLRTSPGFFSNNRPGALSRPPLLLRVPPLRSRSSSELLYSLPPSCWSSPAMLAVSLPLLAIRPELRLSTRPVCKSRVEPLVS